MVFKLTSIEFVHAANPSETTCRQIVQSDKVVVTGKTMDRANANFMESSKEILGNVHRLLEILHPDVDVGHG
jgi:hypothetical protein